MIPGISFSRSSCLFICFGLAGGFFLWFLNGPWGIGLSPDSVSYIHAARTLFRGEGLQGLPQHDGTSVPMNQYGPLYPIVLAALGLLRIDPLAGARILNSVLFGLNIFLIGRLLRRSTRSFTAGILGCLLMAFSFVTLQVHAYAWSEPLLILFTFLGLSGLAFYLERPSPPLLLFLSAAVLSLAFLTKYSGAAVIPTLFFSLLLFTRKPFPQRLVESLAASLAGSLPMVWWILQNKKFGYNLAGLTPDFHPGIGEGLAQSAAYLSIWLLPKSVPAVLRGFALLLVGMAALWALGTLFRKKHASGAGPPSPFLGVLAVFIVCHIGTYMAADTFFGWQSLDDRALSPVYAALVILGVSLAAGLRRLRGTSLGVRSGFSVVLLPFVFFHLIRGFGWGIQTRREGLGYAGREWKESEIVQKVKDLPPDTPIYTNGVDALNILAGRPSSALPAKEIIVKEHVRDAQKRKRADYASELLEMKKVLEEKRGVLVYLDGVYWRWYYPSKSELSEALPLEIVSEFSDGTIYRIKS